MGQATLPTTFNELKYALLLPIYFFAGQIILDMDIGGLSRIFVQKRAIWTVSFV